MKKHFTLSVFILCMTSKLLAQQTNVKHLPFQDDYCIQNNQTTAIEKLVVMHWQGFVIFLKIFHHEKTFSYCCYITTNSCIMQPINRWRTEYHWSGFSNASQTHQQHQHKINLRWMVQQLQAKQPWIKLWIRHAFYEHGKWNDWNQRWLAIDWDWQHSIQQYYKRCRWSCCFANF